MKTPISFIYFDVGGVVLLDFSGTDKWIQLKRDLGVSVNQDKIFDSIWNKHRNRICLDCDIDQILSEFESALDTQFTTSYSMLTDFVDRFEKNPTIWPIIQSVKEKYRVGLLTNMYPRMLNAIKAKKLIPPIHWDAVVDSSIVGFQKPDEGIYQVAEKMASVKPQSIFFIDNSQEHVEAAEKRGWQTFLYDPQKPVESSRTLEEYLFTR